MSLPFCTRCRSEILTSLINDCDCAFCPSSLTKASVSSSGKLRGPTMVTVVYHSRRLFVLPNELGVRQESKTGLILLSGDENMCIVDTESKIQEEECWKGNNAPGVHKAVY